MFALLAVVLLLAPPPVAVGASPGKLRITTGQCHGADLTVTLANRSARGTYASVRVTADPALHVPRRLIETWLPPGYTRTVPVTVSAPAGTAPGKYTVTAGDEAVPVVVASAVPSKNLARNASAVTASSARAGLLACGAADGDADPARWWKGTGWADATGKVWPDWYHLAWPAPQRIARVELVTTDSAEFPAARFGLRDWDVQVATAAGWVTAAEVRGNTKARVTSTFAPRTASGLRILTHAANGADDWSRITEVSVYAAPR
jgi:hypothetical protein